MSVLSPKVIYPIVVVAIFGFLAAAYINDRSKNPNNYGGQAAANSTSPASTSSSHDSNPNLAPKAIVSESRSAELKAASREHAGFSGSVDEYLDQAHQKRSKELMQEAEKHVAFSGSANEYLGHKASTTAKTKSSTSATSSGSHGATSMSLDEYLARAEGNYSAPASHTSNDAYEGDVDGYLKKYSSDKAPSSSDPFGSGNHKGFHGSYEEYSKKYN